MSESGDLIARLRDAGGPDDPVDPGAVVEQARVRRGRRTAVLSSLAAVALIGGAVGIGTRILPARDMAGVAASAPSPDTRSPESPSSSGPLVCPTGVAWADDLAAVPDVPSAPVMPRGVDPTSRLVPDAVPVEAIVCRYGSDEQMTSAASTPSPGATLDSGTPRRTSLSGSVPLTQGLAGVPDDLAWLPRRPASDGLRMCTFKGGPTTPYLLGLRYAGATGEGLVWVAASDDPSGCRDSDNGAFTTKTSLGSTFATASRQKRWPAPRPADPCEVSTGRLGSDTALIPPGAVSAVLCAQGSAHPVPPSTFRKVQEVLAPVRVDPRTAGVTCPAGATARQRLVISYDRGPTTWLLAGRDCQPQLAGPLLGATDVPPQFWSLLDRVAQAPRTTIGPAR